MPQILIAYTFFISYLSVILIFLLCLQLVVKTKYIDINKAFSLLTVHCGW